MSRTRIVESAETVGKRIVLGDFGPGIGEVGSHRGEEGREGPCQKKKKKGVVSEKRFRFDRRSVPSVTLQSFGLRPSLLLWNEVDLRFRK